MFMVVPLMVKAARPLTAGRIKHLARQAELESKTGASGLTLLHYDCWEGSPVARLVESGAIGHEELRAAHDISTSFLSMAGALMVRAQGYELRGKGPGVPDKAFEIDAQQRYKHFAAHWSRRRAWGDRTLEILIETVIDQRPFYLVDSALNLRHGKARKATIRGLRDYAVRAEFIDRGGMATQWTVDASNTFRRAVHPELSLATARARVETSL